MPAIYVKTKPGRIARDGPKGRYIPEDQCVRVNYTPYIARLLTVHEDIIRCPDPVETPVAKKAAAAATETK